jgi:hypothetical protein
MTMARELRKRDNEFKRGEGSEMHWKIEGYGRFESRQGATGRQDHNNTSTRHGIIKADQGKDG